MLGYFNDSNYYLVFTQRWVAGYMRKGNPVIVHGPHSTLRWRTDIRPNTSHWSYFTMVIMIPVNKNIWSETLTRRTNKVIGHWMIPYQDLNFFYSGVSGFTSAILLLNVDSDTPKTRYEENITNRTSYYSQVFENVLNCNNNTKLQENKENYLGSLQL